MPLHLSKFGVQCFIFAILIGLLGSAAATEIEGNWRSMRPKRMEAVFIGFGADGSFYIDSPSYWYQGSYELEIDDESSRLILNVEDGSQIVNTGKQFTYSYDLEEKTLILKQSQNPGILESQSTSDRAVFITINYDSDDDDEDEDEFTLYASCFLQALGRLILFRI